MVTDSPAALTTQTWRLERIDGGHLAWLYVIPHAVN